MKQFSKIIVILFILAIFSSCSSIFSSNQEFTQDIPLAEVVFESEIPALLEEDQTLFLELLDEVSGLNYNKIRYEMQQREGNIYFVRIPLKIGSVIHYRYFLESPEMTSPEYLSTGEEITYRSQYINQPKIFSDKVAGWKDSNYSGDSGEISGFVIDASNNSPIPNILVSINGMQVYTASDGSYKIKNVPEGQFFVTATHPYGTYQAFSQEAVIAAGATTPAIFSMESASFVDVNFEVNTPANHVEGATIRIIGNLYNLGNTFSMMPGGVSALASRAPTLSINDKGKYSILLQLPVGFDLRYKYTLGDGFWNSERFSDGSLRLRELIVPDKDITIRNTISSWQTNATESVTFNITTPPNTPSNEIISIQFNPYAWMRSIPMWKVDENKWEYVLYNPPELFEQTAFRICRNDQCSVADDAATPSINANGYSIINENRQINYSVESWNFFKSIEFSYNLAVENIPKKENTYKAGFEIDQNYQHSWQSYFDWSIVDIGVNNANLTVLTPTWSVIGTQKDSITLNTDQDMMLFDLFGQIELTRQSGMDLALFPRIHLSPSGNSFWSTVDGSYLWWHNWFDQYRNFVLHFTYLAALTETNALIIGGEELAPFLQPDEYNIPSDVEKLFDDFIQDIRLRYSGELILALPYTAYLPDLPQWAQQFDSYYILFSSSLTSSNSPTVEELTERIAKIIDGDLYTFYSKYGKNLMLGIGYASYDGSASVCLANDFNCQQAEPIISATHIGNTSFVVDLQEQADIYLAFLRIISQRNWISGFISRGYYPPVKLLDYSSSIHGKPAETIVAYWFSKMLD